MESANNKNCKLSISMYVKKKTNVWNEVKLHNLFIIVIQIWMR